MGPTSEADGGSLHLVTTPLCYAWGTGRAGPRRDLLACRREKPDPPSCRRRRSGPAIGARRGQVLRSAVIQLTCCPLLPDDCRSCDGHRLGAHLRAVGCGNSWSATKCSAAGCARYAGRLLPSRFTIVTVPMCRRWCSGLVGPSPAKVQTGPAIGARWSQVLRSAVNQLTCCPLLPDDSRSYDGHRPGAHLRPVGCGNSWSAIKGSVAGCARYAGRLPSRFTSS